LPNTQKKIKKSLRTKGIKQNTAANATPLQFRAEFNRIVIVYNGPHTHDKFVFIDRRWRNTATHAIEQIGIAGLHGLPLMERIKLRDESALAEIHKRHHRLIRSLVNRIINNDHDADELVQECLLEIWNRAASYCAGKGMALAWMATLVRRRTIDRLRRKTAYLRAQERSREESVSTAAKWHAGADDEVALSDRAGIVSALIERLPAAQQEVVRLTYFRGMTQREIASQSGIPLGTVKTRLELGLRKLRSAAQTFASSRGSNQAYCSF